MERLHSDGVIKFGVSRLLDWYNQIQVDILNQSYWSYDMITINYSLESLCALLYLFHWGISLQKMSWIPGAIKWNLMSNDEQVICKTVLYYKYDSHCVPSLFPLI